MNESTPLPPNSYKSLKGAFSTKPGKSSNNKLNTIRNKIRRSQLLHLTSVKFLLQETCPLYHCSPSLHICCNKGSNKNISELDDVRTKFILSSIPLPMHATMISLFDTLVTLTPVLHYGVETLGQSSHKANK